MMYDQYLEKQATDPMIPTPQELIKEALQSGRTGVKGRQAPVGSAQRMAERATRKTHVIAGMMKRKDAKFRDRSKALGLNAPTDGAASKDEISKRLGAGISDMQKKLNRQEATMRGLNAAALGVLAGGGAAGLYMLHKKKKENEAALQAQRAAAQRAAMAGQMKMAEHTGPTSLIKMAAENLSQLRDA